MIFRPFSYFSISFRSYFSTRNSIQKESWGVFSWKISQSSDTQFQFNSLSLFWKDQGSSSYKNFQLFYDSSYSSNFEFFQTFLNQLYYLKKSPFLFYFHGLNAYESSLFYSYFSKWSPSQFSWFWNRQKEVYQFRWSHFTFQNSFLILPFSWQDWSSDQGWRHSWEFQEFHRNSFRLYLYYWFLKSFENQGLKDYGLSLLSKTTFPQFSFQIYESCFQNSSLPKLPNSFYWKLRSAYYGGYSLWFQKSGENLYHYDVNSLYPAMMLKPLPGNYLGFCSSLSLKEFQQENYFGFFQCTVGPSFSSPLKWAIWPFSQSFPHSPEKTSFQGLFFSEEIKHWIEWGYSIEIHFGYSFSRLEGLFDNYVHYLFKKKQKDPFFQNRFLTKLWLNSLTGYWGRYPFTLENRLISIEDSISSQFEDLFYFSKDQYWSRSIHQNQFQNWKLKTTSIHWAAAITSYGRIEMNHYYLQGGQLYYSDCDSLIVDKPWTSKGLGSNLGQLKLVHSIRKGYFLGKKWYGYQSWEDDIVITSGGLPFGTVHWNDLIELHQGKQFHYRYWTYLQNWGDTSSSCLLPISFHFPKK